MSIVTLAVKKQSRYRPGGAQRLPGNDPLYTELNPTCHLLALLGALHILHVSRIRVKVPRFRDNSAG